MKYAIVSLCFNCLDLTKKMLESVKKSRINVPFNFVIVDNNSTDKTGEYLGALTQKDIHPNCQLFTVIYQHKNKGCAAGWNSGINRAFEEGAEYVIETNNDIQFHPDAIQNMFNAAEKYPDYGFITAIDAQDKYLEMELKDEVWEGLCWSCYLFKKWSWDKFGGFDERIYPVKGEDYLAHGKLLEDKINCVSIKTAYVNHLGDGTGKGNPDKQINWAAHLAKNMEYIHAMNFQMSEEEKDKIAPPKDYIKL